LHVLLMAQVWEGHALDLSQPQLLLGKPSLSQRSQVGCRNSWPALLFAGLGKQGQASKTSKSCHTAHLAGFSRNSYDISRSFETLLPFVQATQISVFSSCAFYSGDSQSNCQSWRWLAPWVQSPQHMLYCTMLTLCCVLLSCLQLVPCAVVMCCVDELRI
jgi:hypothetical protein